MFCFLKNKNKMVLTLHHLLVYGNVTEIEKKLDVIYHTSVSPIEA